MTDKSQVDAVFAKFAGDGSIDILVSGAAVIGPRDAIGDVDSDKFLEAIQTNLEGALAVSKAFLRHASPNAVAIEINSAAAHANFEKFAAYSVAKLAVFRLWDFLAFSNPDISVFHIHPGVVDTAMHRESGGAKTTGFEDHGK